MNPNMLSFDEAYEKLLGFVRPVREVEEVDTMFAAGRVLAVDQHSAIDQPPMDNSGMDGYALRAADVPVAGTRLPVSQRIPAGSVGHELAPGTAARIFTGAPLPPQTSTIEELADRLRIICSVYDPLTGRYRTNYALYFEIAGFISFLFFLGWVAWSFTRKNGSDRIQSG